jgi:hypothetical protein
MTGLSTACLVFGLAAAVIPAESTGRSLPSAVGGRFAYQHADGRARPAEEVCEMARRATCLIEVGNSGELFASGVLIEPSGVLLTGFDVVEQGLEMPLRIRDAQGRALDVDGVLGFDARLGWVALRLHDQLDPLRRFSCVPLGNSRWLRPEGEVITMGHPGRLPWTCGQGHVRHLGRVSPGRFRRLLQIEATTTPGNCGGGLFTPDGALVGLDVKRLLPSSESNEAAFTFAVPAHEITLPRDTSGVVTMNEMRSFLSARKLLADALTAVEEPAAEEQGRCVDWLRVTRELGPLSAVLPRFPEAALLAARAALDAQQPDAARALCRMALHQRPDDCLGQVLLGVALLRTDDSLAARTAWVSLLGCDSLAVRWAIRESALFDAPPEGAIADPADSLMAHVMPDSAPQRRLDYLSSQQRSILSQFGVAGVQVLAWLGQGLEDTDIASRTGTESSFVRQVATALEELDSSESGEATPSIVEIDTSEVALTLQRLYRRLETRPDRWARAEPIARELLHWLTDRDVRAQALVDLGEIYYMQDRLALADSVMTEAIETSARAPLQNVFALRAEIRSLLGDCHGAMRDIAHARELLEDRTLGECGPHCRETRVSLLVTEACVLLREGRHTEVGVVMKQVVEQEQQWKGDPAGANDRLVWFRRRESMKGTWARLGKK